VRAEPAKAFSGATKVRVCQPLHKHWEDLADWFDIPLHHRALFGHGREPQGVWEWLEERDKITELNDALIELGLNHVASLL
jgi:hypothetical protein